MRGLISLVMFALASLAAPVPKAVKDADSLSGEWEVVERRTGKVAPKGAAGVVWAILGEELTIRPKGANAAPITTAEYKLVRPEKGKKGELDYRLSYPDGKPTIVYRGRFEVDGETMRFCYTTDSTADRPTDFEPREKVVVYTFKRVTDSK
jgi:uncharacterized protein (TIGR03067 family)